MFTQHQQDFAPEFTVTNALAVLDVHEQWAQDLSKHMRLVSRYEALVTDYRKLISDVRAAQTDAYTSDHPSETSLGHSQMALTAAVGEVIHMKTDLVRRLAEFNDQITQVKEEITAIETRALTYEPSNAVEANLLVSLVAKVLEFGGSIPPNYLSDILGRCKEVTA
jgi:hypothetical protein